MGAETKRGTMFIVAIIFTTICTVEVKGQPDFAECKRGVADSWNKLMGIKDSTQYTFEERLFDKTNSDRLLQHKKVRLNRSATCIISEDIVLSSPSEGKYAKSLSTSNVYGINTIYTFNLTKKAESDGWILSGPIHTWGSEPVPKMAQLLRESLSKPSLAKHLSWGEQSLPDLFAHPSFVLTNFTRSPTNANCMRVTFKARPYSAEPDATSLGWMDLDPGKGWSIIESSSTDVIKQSVSTGSVRYTVEMFPGSIPLLREEVSESKQTVQGKLRLHLDHKFTYEPRLDSNLPETAFTMSIYGLPEPVGVTWEEPKKFTPLYVWLLAGAGGFAILAMTFAYLRRRLLRKRAVTVGIGVKP